MPEPAVPEPAAVIAAGQVRSVKRRSCTGADATHVAAAESATHVAAAEPAAHVTTTTAATSRECAARGKRECCCENCYKGEFLAHDIPTF
jgi:hypothetical protein